jgi:hypothetical protein
MNLSKEYPKGWHNQKCQKDQINQLITDQYVVRILQEHQPDLDLQEIQMITVWNQQEE